MKNIISLLKVVFLFTEFIILSCLMDCVVTFIKPVNDVTIKARLVLNWNNSTFILKENIKTKKYVRSNILK